MIELLADSQMILMHMISLILIIYAHSDLDSNELLMNQSNKPPQTPSSSLPAVILAASSGGVSEDFSGVRSSTIYTLPYWRPTRPPIDPMNTIHLGFIHRHFKEIVDIDNPVDSACMGCTTPKPTLTRNMDPSEVFPPHASCS